MTVYRDFAYLYARGPYPEYSALMAEQLETVLDRIGSIPKTVLDVACGEGTFAVAAAKRGLRVTGIDFSETMLALARERAAREGVSVEFLLRDMRSMGFDKAFDLATCWYDSLNYILNLGELERAFLAIANALTDDGYFVFDMNTVFGLAVNWQRQSCYVQQDTAEIFEVHRADFDYETNVATLRVTGFLQRNGRWSRIDEVHRERGYSLDEIRQCGAQAGFREIARWGDIRAMTPPTPKSGRIWFALQKHG
jgi:ubiquinone/menaquinone biosynthesis C-methylase UbiE